MKLDMSNNSRQLPLVEAPLGEFKACAAQGEGICYNFGLRRMTGAELYDYPIWKTGTDTP